MRLSLALSVFTMAVAAAFAQEEPVARLRPPVAGAQPIEVAKRPTGWYSAVSKLKNTDTRDGIGVRWNWPKVLGDKDWGAKGTVSLVAFPNEAVAYGKDLGMALRLVNRGKESARFTGCDSGLPIVQEALDDKGRWREIESVRSSWCGNSYHELQLAGNEYWEFSAPVYAGAIKTKVRFRLDAAGRQGKGDWVYSNEFDGKVAKVQFSKMPSAVETRKAFASKDAKEPGVVSVLIELLTEHEEAEGRRFTLRWERDAAEHLGDLGPSASAAAPALRKLRGDAKGETRTAAIYGLWRIDGNLDECMKAVIDMLKADEQSQMEAAYLCSRLGPHAKDAVPLLCSLAAKESSQSYRQDAVIMALARIRARADLAVPALVKVLQAKGGERGSAIEALIAFGAEARPALPALLTIVKEAKDHLRVEAAYALWKIDGKLEPAVPVLVEELTTLNVNYALARLGDIGPPAKAAVPALRSALKNDKIALSAAGTLWKITREPEPTLTLAIRALQGAQRQYALDVLEEMGPQARPAVPTLLAQLKAEPNEYRQEEIRVALRKIDPDALKKIER